MNFRERIQKYIRLEVEEKDYPYLKGTMAGLFASSFAFAITFFVMKIYPNLIPIFGIDEFIQLHWVVMSITFFTSYFMVKVGNTKNIKKTDEKQTNF